MDATVYVSPGNTKLGKIPNVSLLPGASCLPGALCWKQGCYAAKFCLLYENVHRAWADNYAAYKHSPAGYFSAICHYLFRTKPKYFRWHVGGDIPDKEYYNRMLGLAEDFPKIRFLAFTKRTDIVSVRPMKNLTVVFSRWPGMPAPTDDQVLRFPQAWMYDKNRRDVYLPIAVTKDAGAMKKKFWCPGSCAECDGKKCWALKPGEFVVFAKH